MEYGISVVPERLVRQKFLHILQHRLPQSSLYSLLPPVCFLGLLVETDDGDVRSSETSAYLYQTTRPHIHE
jgi:hypothetical protein